MSLMIRFQKTILILAISLIVLSIENGVFAMFKDMTDKIIPAGTSQRNYGVAVTNVGEGDGPMEWVIAGYRGPNIILQKDPDTGVYKNIAQNGTKYENLMDVEGNSIGVCACDIDGDGKEEIYFLNTNNRYSGRKDVTDRLFIWRNNRYENLFDDKLNKNVLSMYSGRSVACIDRNGNGKYGFLLATYAEYGRGKFELIEMNEQRSRGKNIVLHSIAESVGINFTTGGRGIAVGPVLGEDGFSDIYFVNEGNWRLRNPAENAFYMNDGSGHFSNIAAQLNLNDYLPGRGVTLADFNNDQLIDIVYGNWDSRHKLLLQRKSRTTYPTFISSATPGFEDPSPIRTVIAADFDNDGVLEVFLNNIAYQGNAPNKLFKISPHGRDVNITVADIGDALEKDQHGTGAAVADIDNDGVLELLIAHGESASQALTLYHVKKRKRANNNFIRIMPTTQWGAPARGSKVILTLNDGKKLTRIIDGGSGYLCQMEPVAHFGLGDSSPREVDIQWPDGHHHSKVLSSRDMNKMHQISFNGVVTSFESTRRSATLKYSPGGQAGQERGGNMKDSSSKESRNTRRVRINTRRGHRRRERNRNRNNQNRSPTSGRRRMRPSPSNIMKSTSVRINPNRSGTQRQYPTHSRGHTSRSESPSTRNRFVKTPTETKVEPYKYNPQARHTARESARSGRQSTDSRYPYRRYPYSSRRGEDPRSQRKPRIRPEPTSTTSSPAGRPTGYWQRYYIRRPTPTASTIPRPRQSGVSRGRYPSRWQKYYTRIASTTPQPGLSSISQRQYPSRWQKYYTRIAPTTPQAKPLSGVSHGQYPSRIRVNRPQTRPSTGDTRSHDRYPAKVGLHNPIQRNSTRVTTPSRGYHPSTNERHNPRRRYSVESHQLSRGEHSPKTQSTRQHYRTEHFKGQVHTQNRHRSSYPESVASNTNTRRKSVFQPNSHGSHQNRHKSSYPESVTSNTNTRRKSVSQPNSHGSHQNRHRSSYPESVASNTNTKRKSLSQPNSHGSHQNRHKSSYPESVASNTNTRRKSVSQPNSHGSHQNRHRSSYPESVASNTNTRRKSVSQPNSHGSHPRVSVDRDNRYHYDWRRERQPSHSSHSTSGGRRRVFESLTMKEPNTREVHTSHRRHPSSALNRPSSENSRSRSRHLTHTLRQSGRLPLSSKKKISAGTL